MILESTVSFGNMTLSDAGSWASLIGLVITCLTFLMASNVNKKVNGILKQEKDRKFFDKKVAGAIKDLKIMLEFAEEGQSNYWNSTKQQSRINNAIEIVTSSWNVLMPYQTGILRRYKIMLWERKFKKIKEMYSGTVLMNSRELIVFLTEFVTFLEKEMENNE